MAQEFDDEEARRQFANALTRAGLVLDAGSGGLSHPIMDGQIHRVPTVNGKKGSADGAYVGHLDGKVPAGFFMDWKSRQQGTWSLEGVQLTEADRRQLAKEARLMEVRRQAERASQHEGVAKRSVGRWSRMSDAPPSAGNAYLQRKGVSAYGVKFDGRNMVVPLRDVDGKLWSLQTVLPQKAEEGGSDKFFAKHGRVKGNMHLIGDVVPGEPIAVVEGYATGASIHQATGRPVAIAFDAGNIEPVVAALRARHPSSPPVVLGDNDHLVMEPILNPGVNKGLTAARIHDVGVGFPEFAKPGRLTDFNDLHASEGLDAVRLQAEAIIARAPAHARAIVEARFPEVIEQLDKAPRRSQDASPIEPAPTPGQAPLLPSVSAQNADKSDTPAEPVKLQAAPIAADGQSQSSPRLAAGTTAPVQGEVDTPAETRTATRASPPEGTTTPLSAIDATTAPERLVTIQDTPEIPLPAVGRDAPVPPNETSAREATMASAEALAAIENRLQFGTTLPRDAVTEEAAKTWVEFDLLALRTIGSGPDRAEATHAIGINVAEQIGYRLELQRQAPVVAAEVTGIDARQARQDTDEASLRPVDRDAPIQTAETVARETTMASAEALAAIERRLQYGMSLPRNAVNDDAAKTWLEFDLLALRTIGQGHDRTDAELAMGATAVEQVAYLLELQRQNPVIAAEVTETYVRETLAITRNAEISPEWHQIVLEDLSARADELKQPREASVAEALQASTARQDLLALASLDGEHLEAGREIVRDGMRNDTYRSTIVATHDAFEFGLPEVVDAALVAGMRWRNPLIAPEVSDDRLMASLRDRTAVDEIRSRLVDGVAGEAQGFATADVRASQDLEAFQSLRSPEGRASASMLMHIAIKEDPEYGAALRARDPEAFRSVLNLQLDEQLRMASVGKVEVSPVEVMMWMRNEHAAFAEAGGLAAASPTALAQLARDDLISVAILSGGSSFEAEAKGLTNIAKAVPAYREEVEYQAERLQTPELEAIVARHKHLFSVGRQSMEDEALRTLVREDLASVQRLEGHPAQESASREVASMLPVEKYRTAFAIEASKVDFVTGDAVSLLRDDALVMAMDARATEIDITPWHRESAQEARARLNTDLADYGGLQGEAARERAALLIAHNALQQPEYRVALEEREPTLARSSIDMRADWMREEPSVLAMPSSLDLSFMQSRHENMGGQSSDAATAAEHRSTAFYDVLALQALRGHEGEGAAVDLALAASRIPASREELAYQSERLGVPLPVRWPEQGVDFELPLATDPNDVKRREEVQRRAGDIQALAGDLSAGAAVEMVTRDVAALRVTGAPEERLAIAVAMGANVAAKPAYAQALENADPEIGRAVVRAHGDVDAMTMRLQASQTVRLDEDGRPQVDPIFNRGGFASDRTAGAPRKPDGQTSAAAAERNSMSADGRDERLDLEALKSQRRRIAAETASGGADDERMAEIVGKMNERELKAFEAAKTQKEKEDLLLKVQTRVDGEAHLRPGRSSIPPLDERFTVVSKALGGREYYLRDNAGQLAFTERWLSIGTSSNSAAIVKGMLDRADELGWATVRLNGSAEFKRIGWIAAEARGIKALGYEPTQGDRQAAAEERAKLEQLRTVAPSAKEAAGQGVSTEGNTVSRGTSPAIAPEVQASSQTIGQTAGQTPGQTRSQGQGGAGAGAAVPEPAAERAPEAEASRLVRRAMTSMGFDSVQVEAAAAAAATVLQGSRLHVGELLEVGSAPYRNIEDNKHSPFVKIRTAGGERTVWGVDIPNAIATGNVKVGDQVALEYRGSKAVTVDVLERDSAGKIVGERPAAVDRNTWFAVALGDLPSHAQREAQREAQRATSQTDPALATVPAPRQAAAATTEADVGRRDATPAPKPAPRAPAVEAPEPALKATAAFPPEVVATTQAERQVRAHLAGAPEQMVNETARRAAELAPGERVYVGVLREAGTDPYLHDERNARSPYVVLETVAGKQTVWGADLPSAVRLGEARLGDSILLAQQGARPVDVGKVEFDSAGKAVGERAATVSRNGWIAVRLEDLGAVQTAQVQANRAAQPQAAADPLQAPEKGPAPRPGAPSQANSGAPGDPHQARAVGEAFEKVLDSKNLTPAQRDAARAALQQQMQQRQAAGEKFGVKVFDVAAPRPTPPKPESNTEHQGVKPEQRNKRSGPSLSH